MKKINIVLIFFSLINILLIYIPKTKTKDNNSSSNLPSFKLNEIKLRGNDISTIEINNTSNYDIIFKTSNSNKIRIIESSNSYVKFQRIKPFTEIESIDLYVNNKKYDRLDIICFNEITKIHDISIYEYNSKIDISKNENYKYQEGIYTIEFTLEKLNKSLDFENDTILELEDFILENISKEITRTINEKITYSFYLDFDFFFKNSNYKTVFFLFDDLKYAINFQKAR